jgi:hypothetical protein
MLFAPVSSLEVQRVKWALELRAVLFQGPCFATVSCWVEGLVEAEVMAHCDSNSLLERWAIRR